MISTIEITVLPNGEVKLETKGFAGDTCRQASRFQESSLGVSSREQLTAEYFQHNTHSESVREGQ